jgi:hypothetical protein
MQIVRNEKLTQISTDWMIFWVRCSSHFEETPAAHYQISRLGSRSYAGTTHYTPDVLPLTNSASL